ncbi:tetratricopeptide repeat protein [Siminovitchia fortis]|uniref:Tetratricopeptide repeat protein n=1 Tax=Siminovitchia fortis TaxID=254758 RepID=A0A443IIN0_9BACI|nr:tetratricopeptide repeat protein [Siminovitchia fortis]RWR03961.1 tetratricopeptide repeat protein [Siminovitchia fortis]WHY82445.1 tetratricopeptide repeat protein [Siminovitchia fortis]
MDISWTGMKRMEEKLELALKLKFEGELEKSRLLLLEILHDQPLNAEINFQCGQIHDALGLEEEALEFYKKAIKIGLPDELLKDAYVCLGSTYRVLGSYQKSLDVLSKGQDLFPDYRPLHIFKALTLYSLHEHQKAMEIMLKTLVETTSDAGIGNYGRALRYYSEHLKLVK